MISVKCFVLLGLALLHGTDATKGKGRGWFQLPFHTRIDLPKVRLLFKLQSLNNFN
jgi:hypothetical protein